MSPAIERLFGVEARNEGGVQPPTLTSVLESYNQASVEDLLRWCGFEVDRLPHDSQIILHRDMGRQLKDLISKHGPDARVDTL